MYAITGITGNVGSAVARTLIAANQPVRAIVRNPAKAQQWADQGCEVATADVLDIPALAAALTGVEAVFLMAPPVFDPAPDFSEARAIAAAFATALIAAKAARVVYLSTVGAQAAETNLLSQHTLIENELRRLPIPITFLRPAWFLENTAWDIAPARQTGVIPSFLSPLDRPIPMVATEDIGHLAAQLLQEDWAQGKQTGHRTVELQGPEPISPNQIAAAFAELLKQPVRAEVVPHDTWEQAFKAQGMKNPNPRIRMLDGFNQGWITFETSDVRKGSTPLKTVLRSLLESART
jgi:NAD(P)H dehydrogenase (quinone)